MAFLARKSDSSCVSVASPASRRGSTELRSSGFRGN